MTYDLAGKAKDLLLANEEQPKFIYLPFQAPHEPISAPDWVRDRIKLVISVSRKYLSVLHIAKLTIGSFTKVVGTTWTTKG